MDNSSIFGTIVQEREGIKWKVRAYQWMRAAEADEVAIARRLWRPADIFNSFQKSALPVLRDILYKIIDTQIYLFILQIHSDQLPRRMAPGAGPLALAAVLMALAASGPRDTAVQDLKRKGDELYEKVQRSLEALSKLSRSSLEALSKLSPPLPPSLLIPHILTPITLIS